MHEQTHSHYGNVEQAARILHELQTAGTTQWTIWDSAATYISLLLTNDEHIQAIAYGYGEDEFTMLIATDRRVLHIAKDLRYSYRDTIAYDDITNIKYRRASLGAVMDLDASAAHLRIVMFNRAAALHFVSYIRRRCFEYEKITVGRGSHEANLYRSRSAPDW